MRFVLPLLFAVFGAASGVAAGLYLKPASTPASGTVGAGMQVDAHDEQASGTLEKEPEHDISSTSGHKSDDAHDEVPGESEFTKLNNQFIVPVLKDGRVVSMVVLSLSLETSIGFREEVFAQEPRIRDTLLQVLFDHANMGGFDGTFTSGVNMDILKRELKLAARELLGPDAFGVLVTDIARQDF